MTGTEGVRTLRRARRRPALKPRSNRASTSPALPNSRRPSLRCISATTWTYYAGGLLLSDTVAWFKIGNCTLALYRETTHLVQSLEQGEVQVICQEMNSLPIQWLCEGKKDLPSMDPIECSGLSTARTAFTGEPTRKLVSFLLSLCRIEALHDFSCGMDTRMVIGWASSKTRSASL